MVHTCNPAFRKIRNACLPLLHRVWGQPELCETPSHLLSDVTTWLQSLCWVGSISFWASILSISWSISLSGLLVAVLRPTTTCHCSQHEGKEETLVPHMTIQMLILLPKHPEDFCFYWPELSHSSLHQCLTGDGVHSCDPLIMARSYEQGRCHPWYVIKKKKKNGCWVGIWQSLGNQWPMADKP